MKKPTRAGAVGRYHWLRAVPQCPPFMTFQESREQRQGQ